MAEKKIDIDILFRTADAASSVRELRTALRDLRGAAIEAGEGSAEFDKIAQKAGELNDKINRVNENIRANTGSAVENATRGLTNIASVGVGAFSAIQGAAALFGNESKDLQQTLVKLNAAVALTSGLRSLAEAPDIIRDSIAAFKSLNVITKANELVTKLATAAQIAFATATGGATISLQALKVAIASTGIGLLIVAVGSLAAATINLSDATDSQTESQLKLNEANKKYLEDAGKLAVVADTGRSREEQRLKSVIKLLEAQKAPQDQILKAQIDLLKFQENALKEKAAFYKSDLVEFTKIEVQRRDLSTQITAKQIELSNFYVEKKKKKNELLAKNEQDTTKLILDETEKRIKSDRDEFEAGKNNLRLRNEETNFLQDELTKKQQEELDKRRAAQKAYDEEIAKTEQDAFDKKISNAQSAFEVSSSFIELGNALFSKSVNQNDKLSEEAQKKAFQRSKALALVNATINGAQAITSILGQYPKFDGGFAMIAALASASAAIITQIAVISKQKFSPNSTTAETPNSNFSIGGGAGLTPATPSSAALFGTAGAGNVGGGGNAGQGGAVKVFVVESDITNAQRSVDEARGEIRIGD